MTQTFVFFSDEMNVRVFLFLFIIPKIQIELVFVNGAMIVARSYHSRILPEHIFH